MPYYLVATTPTPQHVRSGVSGPPTLQLTTSPADSFHWQSIQNRGPFDTVEAAEAEVARLMPEGWRHLFPDDRQYSRLPDAIRLYTDDPVREATATELSTAFCFRLSDLRKSKASAADIGREAQSMYQECWNHGLDLGIGLTTYLLELANTVVPNGNSLQFLDDAARIAAIAAIGDDRQMRAAMLNASLTPVPKSNARGYARFQLLWAIRDLLNDSGLIMIHLNDDPGDMLVVVRPEGM